MCYACVLMHAYCSVAAPTSVSVSVTVTVDITGADEQSIAGSTVKRKILEQGLALAVGVADGMVKLVRVGTTAVVAHQVGSARRRVQTKSGGDARIESKESMLFVRGSGGDSRVGGGTHRRGRRLQTPTIALHFVITVDGVKLAGSSEAASVSSVEQSVKALTPAALAAAIVTRAESVGLGPWGRGVAVKSAPKITSVSGRSSGGGGFVGTGGFVALVVAASLVVVGAAVCVYTKRTLPSRKNVNPGPGPGPVVSGKVEPKLELK